MLNYGYLEIINFIMFIGSRISNGPIISTNNNIKIIIKPTNVIKVFNSFRSRVLYSYNNDTPIANELRK